MTGEAGDARDEAERVAHYYLRMIERASTGSNRQAHKDELVAALAAAIEARDAYYDAAVSGDLSDDDATPRRRRLAAAMFDLTAALSALRARAGEETG